MTDEIREASDENGEATRNLLRHLAKNDPAALNLFQQWEETHNRIRAMIDRKEEELKRLIAAREEGFQDNAETPIRQKH
jgi:hypothetical protein